MKVIVRGRQAGKTTKLIKECYKHGGYIVCHSHGEAQRIFKVAREMGCEVPLPISYDEFLRREYYGPGVKKLHIDNVDMLLAHIAKSTIYTVTITREKGH